MRPAGWSERLGTYLAETNGKPFHWGLQDCALWTVRAVDVMHMTNVFELLEIDYHTQDGAQAYLDRNDWRTLADAFEAVFDHRPIDSARLIQRGDVLYIPTIHRPVDGWTAGALWMCVGRDVTGPDRDGLKTFPLRAFLPLPGLKAYHV